MQEVGQAAPPSEDWRPVATNVTTPDYTIKELSPRKDYKFRIRQELENGDLSEPTPPIHYYRTQMPMAREPFTLAEYKPVDYTDTTFANRTYVEHLTKFVPPRLPIDKPEMVVINPETVELAWKPARVPDAIRHSSNLTYTIEVRTPPSFDWRELISGLKDLNHTVRKLHSRIDYVFRVRAWNEYGCSEPSLPVSLYRPKKPDGAAELADEEAWERDWELRFGQQVPPKLPMDTPKVLTRSPESIWLSWKPARIPAYATQTPITYAIEVKRPPGTSYHREVSGLVDCQYIMDGLSQSQDYSIQVRAETEFGVSDPTLPVLIQRSKPSSRPGSRRSSLERDIAAEEVNIETMRLDSVTAGAHMSDATFREAVDGDMPAILAINTAEDWDYLPDYLQYYMDNPDYTCIVAEMSHDIVGFVAIGIVDGGVTVMLKAARVSERFRGRGIYRDMEQHCLHMARSKGSTRNVMSVDSTNPFFSSGRLLQAYREICRNPYITTELDPDIIILVRADHTAPIPVSKQTLEKYISSPDMRRYLFPCDVINVDDFPYAAVTSNIPKLHGKETAFFSDLSVDNITGLVSAGTRWKNRRGSPAYTVDVFGTDTASFESHILLHVNKCLTIFGNRNVSVCVQYANDNKITTEIQTIFKRLKLKFNEGYQAERSTIILEKPM